MRSLGVRCAGDSFTYVVIEGDSDDPQVVENAVLKMPIGKRSEQLAWVRSEVREIVTRTKVVSTAFKAAEGNAQTKDLARAECEGVFQEACHSKDLVPLRRVKSQIRTDLKFEGAASDIEAALAPALAALPKNRYEAGLAAMSAQAHV
jgi:hypothetical protein